MLIDHLAKLAAASIVVYNSMPLSAAQSERAVELYKAICFGIEFSPLEHQALLRGMLRVELVELTAKKVAEQKISKPPGNPADN